MQLASELAYFRRRIHDLHGDLINAGDGLPEGAIRHVVESGPFAHLDEEGRTWIVRELEGSFVVRQRRGAFIVKDHKPWLAERKAHLEFYYWDRLRDFYLDGGALPAHVLATLDHDTDQVLDQCGNPLAPEAGARRGMVMGHVQSGKTTNYSALICKAADAGYKVIVLLAGITNSLRAQNRPTLKRWTGTLTILPASRIEADEQTLCARSAPPSLPEKRPQCPTLAETLAPDAGAYFAPVPPGRSRPPRPGCILR